MEAKMSDIIQSQRGNILDAINKKHDRLQPFIKKHIYTAAHNAIEIVLTIIRAVEAETEARLKAKRDAKNKDPQS